MRKSTLIALSGIVLFVIPIPGTFIAGTLVFVLGLIARWFGL